MCATHKEQWLSNNAARSANRKPEKKVKCKKCGLEVFQRDVNRHMKTHKKSEQDPEKKYQCPVCKFYFKLINSLRQHMRIHMENSMLKI